MVSNLGMGLDSEVFDTGDWDMGGTLIN
jgi:hypothetical protein